MRDRADRGDKRSAAASGLIGRTHPVAVLRAELDRTITSHGGLVLVTGETGIGKTALLREAAEHARHRGMLVVHGTCWDREDAPGYWPWVQIGRGLRGSSPDGRPASVDEDLWSLLAADGRLSHSHTTRGDTFRLHDSVSTVLVTASRVRPLLVVLDDLHWADAASVKLLEFVVRHTRFERLLIVGAYRDVEVHSPGHPLARLIPPLIAQARTLTLNGLDLDQVGMLMERTAGREPDDALAVEVHRRTGGNPFFVEQTARLWASGDSLDALTPGIRETLVSRLSHLPAAVVDILTAAAVLGREVTMQVLGASHGVDGQECEALVEQAVRARLLNRLAPDRYAFVHDLVREVLYSSIDHAEARRRHAAVVGALEHLAARGERVTAGDLAHHAYLAGPDIAPNAAVTHLRAAAHDARGRLAFDEAIGHHRRALERVPEGRLLQRAEIALDLAAAQHSAGNLADARATFEEVAGKARELDSAELLARAALGLHDLGNPDPGSRHEVDLIEEAHTALFDHGVASTHPLAVRTMAATGRARAHVEPGDRTAHEQSARALELARRCADDDTFGFSLLAHHDAIWRPGTAPERVALADQLAMVARRTSQTELELQASLLRMVGLLELGDPRALDEQLTFTGMAERRRLPRFRYLATSRQATIATLTGHFEQARSAIDDAYALGQQLGEVDCINLMREPRWALCLLQGHFDSASEVAATIYADDPLHSRIIQTVVAIQRGESHVTTRDVSELLASAADHYHGGFEPIMLWFQAQAAISLADPALCRQAGAALVPVRDMWAVVAGAVVVLGPYAHWLARLDAAQERWDDAIGGFAAADEAAQRLGARPWAIEARLGQAEALLARRATRDTDTASGLLEQVERDATAIGLYHTAERARRMRRQRAQPTGTRRTATTNRHPRDSSQPANHFHFDGAVWTLSFASRTVHLPDAKGLRDLHTLLSRPGTGVAAMDLRNPTGDDVLRATRRLGADPVLDEKAKADYRRRLAQLDQEIEQGVARHEDQRAARLDRERSALIDELRAATGLGGRSRRLGDDAERARKTVTARIRDTLRRLDGTHPELAEHLRASVSTGHTCSYQPTRAVTWSL